MPTVDNPIEPYAVSIRQVAASEGCCVSNVYERLKSGEYVAVKDGRRTLVLWESVKARRAKLQPATFGNQQPRQLRKAEAEA
jgi:hypothetical protein